MSFGPRSAALAFALVWAGCSTTSEKVPVLVPRVAKQAAPSVPAGEQSSGERPTGDRSASERPIGERLPDKRPTREQAGSRAACESEIETARKQAEQSDPAEAERLKEYQQQSSSGADPAASTDSDADSAALGTDSSPDADRDSVADSRPDTDLDSASDEPGTPEREAPPAPSRSSDGSADSGDNTAAAEPRAQRPTPPSSTPAISPADRQVHLRIVRERSGKLRFEPSTLRVYVGQMIDLTVTNPAGEAAVPCTWYLALPHRVSEVEVYGEQAGVDPGGATGYTPYFLARTSPIEPGSSRSVAFEAPETPGEYPYLCSGPQAVDVPKGTLQVLPVP